MRITNKVEPRLDRVAQDRIGRELRAMYDELLRQPLPANLMALLGAHDAKVQPGQLSNRTIPSPSASSKLAAER